MDMDRVADLSRCSRSELIAQILSLEQTQARLIDDIRDFLTEHVTVLLLADRMVSSETTRKYQEKAREMFAGDVFFVACMQIDDEIFDWNGDRVSKLGPGIYRHMRELLREENSVSLYPAMIYDKLVCVVNMASAGHTPLDEERLLLSAFENINARLLELCGRTARVSVSGYHEAICELPSAYRQSLRLVEYRRAYGDGGSDILFYDDVLTSALDFENNVPSQNKDSLPLLVKRAIEAHFKRDILNISMLANQFHVTSSYITRTFRREYGVRPWEYIQQLRIAEAKELMSRSGISGMTLKSIAETVGFGNSANMIRIFKQFEGVTPGEYFRTVTEVDQDKPSQRRQLE